MNSFILIAAAEALSTKCGLSVDFCLAALKEAKDNPGLLKAILINKGCENVSDEGLKITFNGIDLTEAVLNYGPAGFTAPPQFPPMPGNPIWPQVVPNPSQGWRQPVSPTCNTGGDYHVSSAYGDPLPGGMHQPLKQAQHVQPPHGFSVVLRQGHYDAKTSSWIMVGVGRFHTDPSLESKARNAIIEALAYIDKRAFDYACGGVTTLPLDKDLHDLHQRATCSNSALGRRPIHTAELVVAILKGKDITGVGYRDGVEVSNVKTVIFSQLTDNE